MNEKPSPTTNARYTATRGFGKPQAAALIESIVDDVARDAGISLATVYRTVKLFEDWGMLEKHEFGDGRARYEDAERDHHDHLIDMNSGEVIEFIDPDIEALQEKIAERLGYRLKGHRLELYGVPIKRGENV